MFGLQLRFVQQVNHANHAVHGRSDFVAHVGQETFFDFQRAFGLVFGLHEFEFVVLKLGYVAGEGGHNRSPVVVLQQQHIEHKLPHAAVFDAQIGFKIADALVAAGANEGGVNVLFIDKVLGDVRANHFFHGIARSFQNRRANHRNNASTVGTDVNILQIRKNSSKFFFTLAQGQFS